MRSEARAPADRVRDRFREAFREDLHLAHHQRTTGSENRAMGHEIGSARLAKEVEVELRSYRHRIGSDQ